MRKSSRLQPFSHALVGGARLKVEDTGLENAVPPTSALSGGKTGFATGYMFAATVFAGGPVQASTDGDAGGSHRETEHLFECIEVAISVE
jgi:hypothetical protein